MLWLLVPGVLLVLYRTRKTLMAAVFILVATAVVAAVQMPTGVDLGSAVWQSLAQGPVLFFAGFMLTEPRTLPPRRWQQLATAAVVEILLATRSNFGFVANSPELALLIGNLLAFLSGQRGSLRAAVQPLPQSHAHDDGIRVPPQRPLRHAPGQYLELDLPHSRPDGRGRRRVFSLTSHPESKHVKIGVGTADPVSAAKRKLPSLKPGEELMATTVAGHFVLPKGSDPVLFIAAGIGITPYSAHLIFISGSPASVGSLRRAAPHAGARRIHVDSFAGY